MKRLVVVVIAGAVVLIGRTTLSSQSKPTPPTFAKDVAPIVQKNCMSCHRDGQAAPFPLVTYDDVKKRVVADRPLTNRTSSIMSYGEDEAGEFYMLTVSPKGHGIHRFVNSAGK